FIADPAAGNMTMKVDKFQKMWPNGIGLVIEHPEERAQDYALKVENDDLSIMNYTSLQGLVARNAFRTQIFANEF
ncbi:MAG: hypothetical protein KC618_07565, partial [Candidatus Omnitrophica bacterium]|nr:hypothetical protein [Candidatus Omnitrophota bacterium]